MDCVTVATVHEVSDCHSWNPPDQQAIRQAIGGMTPQDLRALAIFASRQLDRVGLPSNLGEDMVQRSILAVMVGIESQIQGRHPRPGDVRSSTALLNYLRGVICSLIHGHRSRSENQFAHTAFEETVAVSSSYGVDIEYNDLSQLFFERLRGKVPRHLRGILEAWRDEHFEYIPLRNAHRRRRSELRAAAAEVLRELDLVEEPRQSR